MKIMNRIVWHHTGGAYSPNGLDRRAYHRLVDGEGRVHNGQFPISANAPWRKLLSGTYAPHTLNLNSGAIGLSVCAMLASEWGKPYEWTHPVKPVQVDALIAESANLCREYGISVGPRTTLSHAEVEPTLGVKQRAKWDFDYPLRGAGSRDPIAIGDELRAELIRVLKGRPPVPPPATRPTLRQGSKGMHVREMQTLIGGIVVDGDFGPNTRAAVVRFQRSRQLLTDGIVGAMTWQALLKG